jgi:hypothetical protein
MIKMAETVKMDGQNRKGINLIRKPVSKETKAKSNELMADVMYTAFDTESAGSLMMTIATRAPMKINGTLSKIHSIVKV